MQAPVCVLGVGRRVAEMSCGFGIARQNLTHGVFGVGASVGTRTVQSEIGMLAFAVGEMVNFLCIADCSALGCPSISCGSHARSSSSCTGAGI